MDDVVEVPAGGRCKSAHQRTVLHQRCTSCRLEDELVVVESVDAEQRVVAAGADVHLHEHGTSESVGVIVWVTLLQ